MGTGGRIGRVGIAAAGGETESEKENIPPSENIGPVVEQNFNGGSAEEEEEKKDQVKSQEPDQNSNSVDRSV